MMDMDELFSDIMEGIRKKSENMVRCKDCKFSECHEVFAICQNEKAESFNQPVRLTTTCLKSEPKIDKI